MHDDYRSNFGCCVNMSPTCQAPKEKRIQCDDKGNVISEKYQCQQVGCCYESSTKSCFHVECGPCNSRFMVSELSEAVLRMKGCERLYFPARLSYVETRRKYVKPQKAHEFLSLYVKCIQDGRVLEEEPQAV